jgi:nicotinate dehydrogenase subunit B
MKTDERDQREVEFPSGRGGTTRREFVKVLGAGIVVVLVTRRPFSVAPNSLALGAEGEAAADEIAAWLQIDPTGAVTIYTGKVEFGQGIRTSLAQAVAEELRVPMTAIRMIMGDTELTPFDQGTFGSRSTPQMGTQLRKVAASTRELLIGLAAERWTVDRSTLAAANGRVTEARAQRSIGYGELTAGRRLTEVVRDDAPLTPATQWTIAGTTVPKVGGREVVTGQHRYTSDMQLPGMVYGKVLRPPSIGATLAALDASAVAAMPNVTVAHDGEFAGVVAASTQDADRALAAMKATWTAAAGPHPSSRDIYDYLKRARPRGAGERMEGGGGNAPFVRGEPDAALAAAEHRLTRSYTVAYIAHVPLEPRAAVAQWSRDAGGEKLTVWTGTQRPFAVRDQVAEAVALPPARVRVIVPDTGSGYGGKHTGECAVEAARLAKASGKPVKLVWTREEEFRWAYFRPAGVIDVDAAARSDGTITAWTFDNYNSGPAGIRPMYAIANQRVTFHPADSPLRQGSYRALAATANHFAREMHIDELAHVVKMDPLSFRVRNIEDPRLRAVFDAAAEHFGWGKKPDAGHGFGIAGGFEKGGYIAACADVSVNPSSGAVRVTRVVTAFDCGAVVNPDGLRNQISGAMIQGIGGALFEAIDFENGVIRNAHLAQYRVPRFSDAPSVEVVLIDRKDQPSMGAGESPLMALAPAVGAAIFQASGVRPSGLPMARNGIKLARG